MDLSKIKTDNLENGIANLEIRKVSQQNFSRIVVIPKEIWRKCGGKRFTNVRIQLITSRDEKYIKLIPILQLEGEIND